MTLACPRCGSTAFRSWEEASIGYPCSMTDDGPEYSGEHYDVADEGTEFRDELACANCGAHPLKSAELVPAAVEDE